MSKILVVPIETSSLALVSSISYSIITLKVMFSWVLEFSVLLNVPCTTLCNMWTEWCTCFGGREHIENLLYSTIWFNLTSPKFFKYIYCFTNACVWRIKTICFCKLAVNCVREVSACIQITYTRLPNSEKIYLDRVSWFGDA